MQSHFVEPLLGNMGIAQLFFQNTSNISPWFTKLSYLHIAKDKNIISTRVQTIHLTTVVITSKVRWSRKLFVFLGISHPNHQYFWIYQSCLYICSKNQMLYTGAEIVSFVSKLQVQQWKSKFLFIRKQGTVRFPRKKIKLAQNQIIYLIMLNGRYGRAHMNSDKQNIAQVLELNWTT